jgi:SET domain-containing protein
MYKFIIIIRIQIMEHTNQKLTKLMDYLTSYKNDNEKTNSTTTPDDLNKHLDFFMQMEKIMCKTNNFDISDKNTFINILTKYCDKKPIPLKNNDIELRKSAIHGQGVFATKNIPQNTVITFYPAHAIHIDETLFMPNGLDNEFYLNIQNNKYAKIYGFSDFEYYFNFVNIIGNPNKTNNKLLLGHMINDSIGNVFKKISYSKIKDDLIKFKNAVAEYYIYGTKNRNCRFGYHSVYPIIYVSTTRDILENEELLTMYGPEYWYDHNYGKNDRQDNDYMNMFKQICDENFIKWITNVLPETKELKSPETKELQ